VISVEAIYENYYKDVYKYVLGLSGDCHVAEDITQETFTKAINGINNFKGECDVRVWLCQIAKNSFYTYARKKGREITESDEILDEKPSGYDFVRDTIDKEQMLYIHKIIHGLSEPYKEVFNLRVFGELSFKQISEIYGKTESWARVTYHRARLLIINEMESN